MNEVRCGIIAGGNWIVDSIKLVEKYPDQQSLAVIMEELQGTGGAPYNVLINLSKLGAPFPLIGAGFLGEDLRGREILAECERRNINTDFLKLLPDIETAYTDVVTESTTGKRTFLHRKGANARWVGEDLDFQSIRAAHFHLGYLLLLDRLDTVGDSGTSMAAGLLERARNAGLTTSIDAVTVDHPDYNALMRGALKYTDFCIIAEDELAKATGVPVRDGSGRLDSRIHRALASALSWGVKYLIVHFPEGAVAISTGEQHLFQPSLNLPPAIIKGSAGAGDAFASGFLLGQMTGQSIASSLEYGVCVAGQSLTHATCTQGICPLAECLELRTKHGYRDFADIF